MAHSEGAWPREVDPTASEQATDRCTSQLYNIGLQVMRWRRKLEKDENYVTSLSLITSVTISTRQNTIMTILYCSAWSR